MKKWIVGMLITCLFIVPCYGADDDFRMGVEIMIGENDSNFTVGLGVRAMYENMETHVTYANDTTRFGFGGYLQAKDDPAYFYTSAGICYVMQCKNIEGFGRMTAGKVIGNGESFELGVLNYGGLNGDTFGTIGVFAKNEDDCERTIIHKKEEPICEPICPPPPPHPYDERWKPGHGWGDTKSNHYGPPGKMK